MYIRQFMALTALLLGLFSIGCSSSSVPCGGKGIVEDKEPLAAEYVALNIIPKGVTRCVSEEGHYGNSRLFEIQKVDPRGAIDLFNKHLVVTGWSVATPTSDDSFIILDTEKEGQKINIKASKKVPDKGWVTVTLLK